MRPTTYSDGMTQVSGDVLQLRRDPAQLPPLAGRPDVPGLVDRFGRQAKSPNHQSNSKEITSLIPKFTMETFPSICPLTDITLRYTIRYIVKLYDAMEENNVR
jgi:hypothetical protein